MSNHEMPAHHHRTTAARLVIVLTLTVAIGAIGAQSALASCAEPPDLEAAFAEADIVFIGVVVELTNNDRTAKMEVESVWKGPQMPDVVTVHGSPDNPDDPNLFTSVDRTFTYGTYIVFPVNTEPPFQDNICTLTQRTTPALDTINPGADELIETVTGVVTTTVAATGDIPPPFPRQQFGAPEPEQVDEGLFPSRTLTIGLATVLMIIGLFAWWRRSHQGPSREKSDTVDPGLNRRFEAWRARHLTFTSSSED